MKPHLIDRMLVAAEKGGVRPLICINKVDLVDLAGLQPLVGVYAQMGYEVLLISAKSGFGIERFHRALAGRANVVVGQSGVGKSSLLNCIDPSFRPRSGAGQRGHREGQAHDKHGAAVAVGRRRLRRRYARRRQFQLWDVTREEVAGYFRDVRPYVNLCRFPDCTHTHEDYAP